MDRNARIRRPLRNRDVREAIEGAGLRYWWVAEELDIAPGTLSNRLRKELLPEEREEILSAVRRLADRLEARVPARPEMTLEARASLPVRDWQ